MSSTATGFQIASPRNVTKPPTAAASKTFIWGAGIECSFIPHLEVDQFEWTQHNRFWKEDFRRARDEVGVSALRYALPWHEIEVQPGRFNWSAADERVAFAAELGLELYLDVMHFGTPTWLRQAAGDPEFPESLERFTTALVERYRSVIHTWSPCNEPLILALFSGDFGFWPPHSRKWRGYMPLLSRVVQATSRAIRAIRRADPQATVLLCDNVENFKTRDPLLSAEVDRRNMRRFLAMDLLTGRFGSDHPLHQWVTAYGMSEIDLEWFRTHPQRPDVLGLDYYPNSEWQLERTADGIRQRRADTPVGLYGAAKAYYSRFALPMMLTETSADGQSINREIWLDQVVEDCNRLRSEGLPMLGCFWWPLIDQLDWDGALTHRIGKVHEVGLYNLRRQPDGTLKRSASPLVEQYRLLVAGGDDSVGTLDFISEPSDEADQGPPIGIEPPMSKTENAETSTRTSRVASPPARNGNAPSTTPQEVAASVAPAGAVSNALGDTKAFDKYGIVVFSHLRWGFVWQRPQQFLSRFARKHRILFVEEPFFDLREGEEPRVELHKVMPNVTVAAPHVAPSWNRNPKLPQILREFTKQSIAAMNERGDFDRPLLWYYSPMDSAWSLGHFQNRGIVYDCMDELSQFTGAPMALVENEARLMTVADVVFTGGYELGEKKSKQHPNVHPFGCGVDYGHFSKASDATTAVPPDIDFMAKPVIGWFGVVDERVDYAMVGEMARMRPNWSFAMVGPVVKVDPNTLPHAPNLFWLGGRDYQQLPNYCRAFDVNMMCFAINAATQFINPTKGLEYMATGKPIVGTGVRDVVRQWSDIVRIASGASEFVAAIEDALRSRGNDPRVQRGLELAKQCSWEQTVANMQGLIRDALAADDRRSATPVAPLNEAELEFSYVATQGS